MKLKMVKKRNLIALLLLTVFGCDEPVDVYTSQEIAFVPGKIEGEAQGFFQAVNAGDLDSVILSIETGLDIDTQDDRGATALHIAAYRGQIDIAEYLILQGADLTLVNNDGLTALATAEYVRHAPLVMILGAASGTDEGVLPDLESTIWKAAAFNDLTAVEYHLSNGEDINERLDLSGDPAHGATALHVAVSEFSNQAAALLIKRGADVNALTQTEGASTPLHWAVAAANNDGVRMLLNAGADSEIKDSNGKTVLEYLDNAPREAEAEIAEIKELLSPKVSEDLK